MAECGVGSYRPLLQSAGVIEMPALKKLRFVCRFESSEFKLRGLDYRLTVGRDVWSLTLAFQDGNASIWDMRVTDAAGVAFTGGTGARTGEVGGQSATLFGFQVPDGVTPTGPFVLEVTALGDDATGEAGERIAGTWRFTFDASQTPSWSRPPAQVTPAPQGS